LRDEEGEVQAKRKEVKGILKKQEDTSFDNEP